MKSLADELLITGKKDLTTTSAEDTDALMAQLPEWNVIQEEGIYKLKREYCFSDYLTLIALTKKIGHIAEQVNHHPVIITQWGKVTVYWWTHTLGGLHLNDFVMAAKCDRAAMLVTSP